MFKVRKDQGVSNPALETTAEDLFGKHLNFIYSILINMNNEHKQKLNGQYYIILFNEQLFLFLLTNVNNDFKIYCNKYTVTNHHC